MSFKKLHNDPILLRQIADGDEDAFRTLVNRYQPYINILAVRVTGNEVMAEDIVQDTFLKVWINRKTLPEKDNFGGWLYRIAVNITLNSITHLDHQKKYTQHLQREGAAYFTLPGYANEQKELEMILHQAVKLLPPRQKQTYTLVKVEGMTHRDAARELNIHPETVKSNLDHALRFIRAFCLNKLERRSGLLLILFFFKCLPHFLLHDCL